MEDALLMVINCLSFSIPGYQVYMYAPRYTCT